MLIPKVNFVDKNTDLFMKGHSKVSGDNDYEDPTYFGFDLRFDFSNTPNRSNGLSSSPLLGDEKGERESAEKYLRNIGADGPADNLKRFKDNLRRIQNEAPYYFQSIEGLKPLWGQPDGAFDPFYAKDIVLTVGCLESLDLLMTSTLDSYRKASQDQTHMRRLLPENLRKFTMTVTISEMRKFNTIVNAMATTTKAIDEINKKSLLQKLQSDTFTNVVTGAKNKLLGAAQAKINGIKDDYENGFQVDYDFMDLRQVDGYASFMVFRLELCEFLVNESFPVDSVDMGSGTFEQIKQQFKIKVGKVTETNYYNLLGYLNSSHRDDYFGSTYSTKSDEGLFMPELKVGDYNLHHPEDFTNHYTGRPVVRASRLGQAIDQLVGKAQSEFTTGIKSGQQAQKVNQFLMGNVYHPNGIQKFLDRNQFLVNLGKLGLS